MKDKNNSPIQQQTHKQKKKLTISSTPYHNAKNFCHCCKLSGRWETKYWRIHLEIHPRNHTTKRRVWKLNIAEEAEFPTYPIQGVEVVQGEIAIQEVCITNKMENRLMTRETTFQWLFSI
jgi:hypothetical protein